MLDGPSPQVLTPFIVQAVPLFLELMKDPNDQVRDTVSWTLGRICEFNITGAGANFEKLVEVVCTGLQDRTPKVASNCAWVCFIFNTRSI